MDYNDILKEVTGDVKNLSGKLEKYANIVEDEMKNINKYIPKGREQEFADALGSQMKEMDNVVGKAHESIQELRKQASK